jgi:hypothetical protein
MRLSEASRRRQSSVPVDAAAPRVRPGKAIAAYCNATTPPDTDGCECAAPGCCSGACQVVHSNGAGQSFYDCVAASTFNQTQATEACVAFTNNLRCPVYVSRA